MTSFKFTGVRINRDYYVEIDDRRYKVTHYTWTASKWQPAGERWTVHSGVGIHAYVHECDPAKPTYKRVVAAVQAALAAPADQQVAA